MSPERLPLEDLQPNPLNPRYTGEDPEVVELAESFKSVGQLPAARIVSRGQFTQIYPDEPIGAQPWVVFIGNRRLAAAPLAEVTHLDVRHDGGLTTADELKDRILVENLHRKDLPPLKEAEALRRRLTRPGVTTRSVGAAIGKSHTYVEQRVTLLGMLPELQDLFRAGQVSIQVGRKLGGWPEAEQRAFLAAGPPYELPVPAPASAGAAVSEAGTATGTVPAGNSATSGGGAAEAAAGNGVARTGGDAAIVARHVDAALRVRPPDRRCDGCQRPGPLGGGAELAPLITERQRLPRACPQAARATPARVGRSVGRSSGRWHTAQARRSQISVVTYRDPPN